MTPDVIGVTIVVIVVLLVLLALVLVFRASWRVAEPDEALIISGLRASGRQDGAGESMGFNIVTGRGALILPGVTKVRRLSLEAHESEISVPCVSQQKIRVDLRGIVVYKVGDDFRSIANAARRFLDRPAAELETKVQNVFVGHLRAIAGSMTVEDMISDQDKFTQQVRDRCTQEMESFGLVIDSFQIQAITSPSADIKKAGYQADIDQATKQAEQQGPLAEAKARQAVVEEETRVAELQAQQTEQQLQVDVRKPADAEAYRQTTLAAASRDVRIRQAEAAAQEVRLNAEAAAAQTRIQAQAQAEALKVQAEAQAGATRLTGEAEGDAIRARGVAEADAVRARMEAEAAGIERRAAALSRNQE